MFRKIRKILSNKNGAVAVLLMCIMGSFILITGILVAAAVSASGKSYSDATFQLAGKSILSEYDRELLDDYGLLCFKGDEKIIENKLKFYASASFSKENPGKVDLLNLKAEDIDANLKEYSMVNVDLYEEQIKKALETTILDNDKRIDTLAKGDKVLRNETVINSLPSTGYEGSFFPSLDDITNIPSWSEITNSASSDFARCEYALKIFKYANGGGLSKETFFNNEIEYILEGGFSDSANYAAVKVKLTAIRSALNAAYLASDKVKMAEIKALSAAAVEGEPIAEATIFAAWVAAETDNDIDLIEGGDEVALIKTKRNWALNDIAKIMKGVATPEGAVKAQDSDGLAYKDYLRVLLSMEDREVMLLRMMDLTQINLKGTYYRDFLLKEQYAGFRFDATVKGDTFNYVEQY